MALVPIILVTIIVVWAELPRGVLAVLPLGSSPTGEVASSAAAAVPLVPPATRTPAPMFTPALEWTLTPPPHATVPVVTPGRAQSTRTDSTPHPLASTVAPTSTAVTEAQPGAGTAATSALEVEATSDLTPAGTHETRATPTKAPPDKSTSGKWIEVDLSKQKLYAHEGQETVLVARVSTGTRYYPTVTGRFKIYAKYRSAPMSGPGYYLPGVPWIMYFYRGYAIHGAYWHTNFGHPMSHGCVNMKVKEAKWLFAWAPKGTLVVVHR